MNIPRPDMSKLAPEVRSYIETLEAEIEQLRTVSQRVARPHRLPRTSEIETIPEEIGEIFDPSEPPTTINIITATAAGHAKRTLRHLYNRQRRGGMGVFDLETPDDEPPAILTVADQGQNLLLMTDQGRAFRLPLNLITEAPVRARGESIVSKLNLPPDEKLAAILPEQAQGYVALLSQRGMVRLLRHHVFGEYMKPGTPLYDFKTFGPLASACWTPGDSDLFIATRQGRAIRFSEKLIPPTGTQGIRLTDKDIAISITAVYPNSGVFLLSADGKGTVRLMEGFAPNKSSGAGGKVAINTDYLVGAVSSDEIEDIFIISKLSKIIRFHIDEVPPKDGVVQGVVCMSLRGDQPVALAASPRTHVL